MWFLNFKFSSKVIPKNSIFLVGAMTYLPSRIGRSNIFFLYETAIWWLLWVLTLILFTFSRWLIVSKFPLIESVMLSIGMFLKLQVEVRSSAKRVNLKKIEHFGKSLMNMRKSRGPSIEPRGTPDLIVESCELWPFNDINCFLSDK